MTDPGPGDGPLPRRRLPGGPTLAILAAAFALTLVAFAGILEEVVDADPIVALDSRIAALVAAHRTPGATGLFLRLTLLGKGEVVAVAAAAACAVALLWRRRHLVAPLLAALAGQEVAVQAIKRLVDRVRPGPALAYYVETSSSFPSGHAAHAAVLYGFLGYAVSREVAGVAWHRALLIAAAAAAILGVGASRIYLGVHYPSDVLGGYLVGLLWLVAGVALAEALRPPGPAAAATSGGRIALTAAAVAAAVLFYAVLAVGYAPPGATIPTPASVTEGE